MSISNYLLLPIFYIRAEFPSWCILVKLIVKPRKYSYPRPLVAILSIH